MKNIIAEISNLAQEVRATGFCFDPLTLIFVTRAFELDLIRTLGVKSPEDVWRILNLLRRIDTAVVSAIRQHYPFLLSLEVRKRIQIGDKILKVVHRIERIQSELDELILEAAKSGNVEKVYEDLFKMLIETSTDLKSQYQHISS